MQSDEIRSRFLKFFEARGHKIIPSASLVPEGDPSVLFNTAGMQPLVPYLLGQEHPMGKRIVNIQKCVRTVDLEDIGDNRHFSFFEMMGNWSLGDYFKEDAIKWSYEFLTSKEEGLGLEKNSLYITIFEGDKNAPLDTESENIWKSLGIPKNRIYALPAEDNWWSPGDNGPCGPCSEMFYDVTGQIGNLTRKQFLEAVEKEDVIEIWNDVFMEYEKKDGKVIGKLKQKNVDTGAGLERMTAVMKGKKAAYDTDLFKGVFELIEENGKDYDSKLAKIIADHIRTSSMLIWDKVLPSNTYRGYVLRRLIRRALFFGKKMGFSFNHRIYGALIEIFFKNYKDIYDIRDVFLQVAQKEFYDEAERFEQTVGMAEKRIEKMETVDAFSLFTSYGLPPDLTVEIAKKFGKKVDLEDFNKKMVEHQKLSQTSSAGMFKGGLANHNEKTVRLHTAHHLLLAGLQHIVSPTIKQRGSNITEERLRMDFLCDHKLTDEEKTKVENWVNEKIQAGLNVLRREMPLHEAEKIGAEMEFGAKYPEVVSLYFIEDKNGVPISKEFCGGPHVTNTSKLGQFKILKEEAVAHGIRRIKAVLL